MRRTYVVIRLDEEGDKVLVNQEGSELSEEEERWFAYLAIPKLERFAFTSEEGIKRWREKLVGARAVR